MIKRYALADLDDGWDMIKAIVEDEGGEWCKFSDIQTDMMNLLNLTQVLDNENKELKASRAKAEEEKKLEAFEELVQLSQDIGLYDGDV